jgi:hypothetical protein
VEQLAELKWLGGWPTDYALLFPLSKCSSHGFCQPLLYMRNTPRFAMEVIAAGVWEGFAQFPQV